VQDKVDELRTIFDYCEQHAIALDLEQRNEASKLSARVLRVLTRGTRSTHSGYCACSRRGLQASKLSALCIAAFHGNHRIVDLLLAKGTLL
jgi:hypothetical protein